MMPGRVLGKLFGLAKIPVPLLDFSHERLSFGRPIASYTKVQILYSHIVRNTRWLRSECVTRLPWLNVGCGPNFKPGFVNLDYCWRGC